MVQSYFNVCITSLPFYWHFYIIFHSSLFILFLSLLGCMLFSFVLLFQLSHLYGTPLSLARLIQVWSGDPPFSLREVSGFYTFLFWPSFITVLTPCVLLKHSALAVQTITGLKTLTWKLTLDWRRDRYFVYCDLCSAKYLLWKAYRWCHFLEAVTDRKCCRSFHCILFKGYLSTIKTKSVLVE